MSGQNTEDAKFPPVRESEVKFKVNSDRDVYRVISEKDPKTTLIEITGYDVQINFNMEYLRSLEDVNAAAEAVGVLFRDVMLEKLLEYKQKE